MSLYQPIIEKIKEIIAELPTNWAEEAGEIMGVESYVIRSYARGDRGIRNGKATELLKILKEMRSEIQQKLSQELIED